MAHLSQLGYAVTMYLKQVLKCRIERTICWTDSSAALHWIGGPSARYKQDAANQLNEINNLTELQCWRYCPSDDRFTIWSITATQLISCNHWWNGYSFSARMLMAVRLEDYIEYTRGRETIFRWWKWTLLKTQNPSLNQKGFLLFLVATSNCISVLRFLENAKGSPSEGTRECYQRKNWTRLRFFGSKPQTMTIFEMK